MNAPVRIPRNSTYRVGYGNPPIENQFKKGRSGNPRGRPKKRRRTLADLVNDQMASMVELKDGGRIRSDRLMIRDLVRDAARLEKPAVHYLFDLIEWSERSEQVADDAERQQANLMKEIGERFAAAAQKAQNEDQQFLAKRRSEQQRRESLPRAPAPYAEPPPDRSDIERNQRPRAARPLRGATTQPPSEVQDVEELSVRQPTWPDL